MGALRQYAFVLAVGLLVGSAVGGSLAVLLVPAPTPSSLVADQKLETVRPSIVDFTDPHEVRVALTVDSASGLRSPVGGVLTSLACVPRGQLMSGTSPFTVDGASVVGLATAVPLWRDIALGDDGLDVTSLESELVRLGAELELDGQWHWTDALAFDALLAGVGVITTDDGTVRLASIAWLPSPAIVIASCPVGVGTTLGAGGVVAQFTPRVSFARLQPPVDAVDGARMLALGNVMIPVEPDGVIADGAALASITDSAEFAQADPEQNPPVIPASWVLASPMPVTVLPPSAVYGLSGRFGCVQEEGGATTVTVIASQLGRTLVLPAHPLDAVFVHPIGDERCP